MVINWGTKNDHILIFGLNFLVIHNFSKKTDFYFGSDLTKSRCDLNRLIGIEHPFGLYQ